VLRRQASRAATFSLRMRTSSQGGVFIRMEGLWSKESDRFKSLIV
jgi:hypothetical protein